jgi:uncharacterized protein
MNHEKNETNARNKTELDKNSQIKIFATNKGLNVIDSPIKAKILSILKDGGLSASKIVSLTGKSKSTISAHLKDLIDAGIVDTKPDPSDGRRKIFYIKSRYLGDLSRVTSFEKEMDNYITTQVTNSNDPFKFFRFIFRTIRVALMEEGVNIDPILHKAGYKVGETFYEKLKDPDTGKLLENIQTFWKKNRLGRVEVEKLDPPVIRNYDCFECEDLPKTGKPACAFDSGILEAIFSAHFGEETDVEEVKCYAMDDNYCCFLIKREEE